MASLGELLGEYLFGLPQDAEVVEGTRGNVLPGAKYRLPDGTERWGVAAPQGLADALLGLGAAGGRVQDPNAPEGYVSQETLRRGGEGLAGSATLGSFATRAPAGALRAGAARSAGREPPKFGVNKDGELVAVRSGPEEIGFVRGTGGDDPQIKRSYIMPSDKGQGIGSELYRTWAEGVGKPFRSDEAVSADAQVMYEQMFPKYGYNVLKNPRAKVDPSGALQQPRTGLKHIYRVEPPGMNSTEFYSGGKNSQAAGLAMELARNQGRDLDPSVPARAQRALDMGFEDQAHYRGMGNAYDPDQASFKPQWFSSNSEVANSYTTPGYALREAPQVMPAYIRPGKMVEIDAGGVKWDEVPFSAIPEELQAKIPTAYPKTGRTTATTDSIVRWLSGPDQPDTIRFRNVLDHAAEEPIPSDVTVVLNPANIRSTQAMFDPARINETDPLAANPLAGAVPLTMPAPGPQGPTISDMGGRPIPPEEEAQRQALIRYLEGGR